MAASKRDFVSIADTPQDVLEHFMEVAKSLKQQHKSTGRNDPIAAVARCWR